MARREEKRKPITCPNCHRQMLCMNRFESIYKLIRGFYVWYVCPRRKGEKGCGHTVLFEISPKTRRMRRMTCPVDSAKKITKK